MFGFTFWFFVKLSANIVACLIFYAIWNYLKRKPLGMPTVLDLMIFDYITLNVFGFLTSYIVYIKFADNWSHESTMAVMHLTHFAVIAIIKQIMAFVGIRYIYVFHPGLAHETSDRKIMVISRCFVGIGALISEFVDDFGRGGPDYTYFRGTSNKDSNNTKVPTFPVIKVAVVLTVLLLIFVQARIELFKKKLVMGRTMFEVRCSIVRSQK